jgi:hypothetical protein
VLVSAGGTGSTSSGGSGGSGGGNGGSDSGCDDVGDGDLCKIADFGLSCPLGTDADYYKSAGARLKMVPLYCHSTC